ncbi:MAG: SAM-dependent methyltransferase, partial [Chloroflexi bacterium]|nr:SAM-dependent methyltransferase [Chloroflexota bacterium]
LVDCMVALPGQLFYSTQIPVCLWFICRNKRFSPSPAGRRAGGEGRDRAGETLFIDARKLGTLVDRVHRELSGADVARIADTYHAWRGNPDGVYADMPGFCKSATQADIAANGYVLTPGRYVGAEDVEDDDEPFEEKIARLTAALEEQFAESKRLESQIRQNLAQFKTQ